MNTISTQACHTPCGELVLGCYRGRLCLCDWKRANHHTQVKHRLQHALNATMVQGEHPTLLQAATELREYFAGMRCTFRTPLLFVGTEFQKHVWQQLLLIPCGSTRSYAQQARELGIPRATRALASAVAANALCLFAPCHRVIYSNGSAGKYAGGSETKRFLLELESPGL